MAQNFFISLLFCLFVIACCIADNPKEDVKVDDEKVEYAKGSVCGYCSYCKVIEIEILNRSSTRGDNSI